MQSLPYVGRNGRYQHDRHRRQQVQRQRQDRQRDHLDAETDRALDRPGQDQRQRYREQDGRIR